MTQLGAITDELSPNIDFALDMACELGIQKVELHTAWGRTVELWDDEQVATVEVALKKRGLSVCCISSTVFLRCHLDESTATIPRLPGFRSIAGSFQEHLDALGRSLEIAKSLRAPIVRIFGFWREGATTDETYHLAAEKIAAAAELAASSKIKLALENCPHTYFDWGARAVRLIEEIGSDWVGMLWDPCSGLRSGEPDYLAHYSTIDPFLLHVHAKDMVLDAGLKRGRKYVPIMQGQIDWVKIFSHLKRSNYDGVVCLETHHTGPDGTRESAAKASFEGLIRAYQGIVLEREKIK